jgi:hypothetical protein
MTYGYATVADAERWHTGSETIAATIAEAITDMHGGEHLPVAICDIVPPAIDCDSLAEDVIERVGEQLYDEVGEVADTFGPFPKEQTDELAKVIREWLDKHGDISCWKADNGRMFSPGDAEYDAALALVKA